MRACADGANAGDGDIAPRCGRHRAMSAGRSGERIFEMRSQGWIWRNEIELVVCPVFELSSPRRCLLSTRTQAGGPVPRRRVSLACPLK
jgi:hypothetical protein